jgi:hypothetical protein
MKKQVSILLYLCLISGLAACNLPVVANPADSGEDITLQYETVSALLTATAIWEMEATALPPVLPATPDPTGTYVADLLVSTPDAPLIVTTRIAGEANEKAEYGSCDQAQAGRPMDITVPDETHFFPGEYFSKTWRLVNVGSCRWTRDYSVVWFSGDDLGVTRAQSFNVIVEPSQVVDVTVDMLAPKTPGTYQSNWKLRSEDGHLFGIGPNSDSPFWVRIVVVPVNTPTLTPTIPIPTSTVAPSILTRGTVELFLEEFLELDLENESEEVPGDLAFLRSEAGELRLVPVNGAGLVLFGSTAPRFEECLAAGFQEEGIALEQDLLNNYFCYRTSEGLPGRLLIAQFDPEIEQLNLEFTTWAVP